MAGKRRTGGQYECLRYNQSYQEFLGGTRVNISGVDFSTDNDRTWAGIGAGGTYAWAGGKYLIFGQGTINTSLDHFADSYAIKGDVGFKVKW
ncbi:autotransporter outer membrane beta-barrel domain-containing protein [Brucella abortus]|nr:autotransporter outer membrane beta-barrel domain-containing protein [Brucella abortus]